MIRVGKAIGPLKKVLDSLDDAIESSKPSGRHKVSSMETDVKKVTSDLLTSKVIEKSPGRFHSTFPNFQPVLSHGNQKKFETWIKSHIEEWMDS